MRALSMTKGALELVPEPTAGDMLTVMQFANVFPMDAVTRVLDSSGCGTVRVRHATNERLVFFQLMLSVFRDSAYQAVYRTVAAALDRLERKEKPSSIPSASALTQGLDRLRPDVFEQLFHELAVPAGREEGTGIWFKNWRKVSIDGFTLSTELTKENRKYFGGPSNQHGTASLPQLRCVCLVETGSHLIFEAAAGRYDDGEATLAERLLPYVESNWILLADRNFYSFDFYKKVSETGSALLFRLQRGMSLVSEKQLSDDSHIVTVYSAQDKSKKNGLKARLIEYYVVGANKKRESFYLLTNILDPSIASASELASVYGERWEHENTLDELKTHLNLSAITFRSKSPERVLQEFWALLMAHYSIRLLMHKAAVLGNIDPDRLSFTHTVHIVKDGLTLERNAVCENCGDTKSRSEKSVLKDVIEKQLPERRARSRPRGVRRREKYVPLKSKEKKFKKTNSRIKVKKQWTYNVPR
jgi:hypothetical protein